MNKKSLTLQNTLQDLEQALAQWEAVIPDKKSPDEEDIRKKTQEILKKLTEQIQELGL